MKKEENGSILIKDLDITVRTKNVLTALKVFTIKDLHTMYVLETIPAVGTIVKYYPLAGVTLAYSKSVNEEVKDLLCDYCHCCTMEELESVGA